MCCYQVKQLNHFLLNYHSHFTCTPSYHPHKQLLSHRTACVHYLLPTVSPYNLQTPCILYIGQTYRSSPEYSFYIFSQQMHLIIFFLFSLTSLLFPHKMFPILPFLVHKIFTFYTNGVLNCKCPAPGPKG